MATTTLSTFLRERRERAAHPASPSPGPARRRTPGLRREEVAARAGVSVTWYTWLEQGRGGMPSEDVLERLSRALDLDEVNREMLFLLAHDRPPPRKIARPAPVPASLQLVLDNLAVPAFVKTPTFQIVAWNRAAVAVFGDYAAVAERERNLLRRIFRTGAETKVHDVDDVRRNCLAAFRFDIARAGESKEATALVAELMETSEDFRRLWAEGEIRSHHGFRKRMIRPGIGELELDATVMSVEGCEGLSMYVFSPATPESADAIAKLLRGAE